MSLDPIAFLQYRDASQGMPWLIVDIRDDWVWVFRLTVWVFPNLPATVYTPRQATAMAY